MAIPERAYMLQTIETENRTSYHISFRDGAGKVHRLNVSYDFYMAFRRLEQWSIAHRSQQESPL